MRNVLLATIAVVALAMPHRAHAAIVFDPAAFAQNATQNMLEWAQWAKEIGHYVKEAGQWVEVLGWYKRQYDTAVSTWNAVSHITDLGSAASALGGVTRNYMPSANDIPSLMRDVNSLWGSAGSIRSHDLYYQSALLDRWGAEMERETTVTSNAKAMTEAASIGNEQSLLNLGILQARLSAATDVTEVSAVNGLIELEGQNLQIQNAQMQNVALLLQADERVTIQRRDQARRESADILYFNTAPITGEMQ
jgi:hypothetical protein